MAATDMKLAGLERGCKVILPEGTHAEVVTVDIGLVAPRVLVRDETGEAAYRHDEVMRDPDDAQAARQARFDILMTHYPGEAGVPEDSDTVERFVLVQSNRESSDGSHAFTWGDTFDTAVEFQGGEVFDGWYPEAVFDLDTGTRIEVHVSSPEITVSEDQGALVNVLDPEDGDVLPGPADAPVFIDGRFNPQESRTLQMSDGLEVIVYRGTDGAWVIDVDSSGLDEDSPTCDDDVVPYVRVAVNDGTVYDNSPDEPLPGSDDAEGRER